LEHITSQFSQGQKWLLHFIASTFSDITLDDPMVLCLDEPELHLHPAALNQVVDILKSTLSNGQLLIATHSIPLIAHVGYDKVWYVADGNISYAGRQPEKVINGLVGGMDGVMKLVELLTEPSAAAVAKFALESLSPPTVVGARDDDPQAEQIIRSVKTKSAALGRPIRLLDYGAGKGRFLDIAAHVLESDVDGLIDYHAYDPSAANAEICRSAIARVYGEGVGTRYFTKKSEIPEVVAGANFDVVLLSNVLHEIAPVDWLKELAFIRDILVPDGEMLIVEDLQLPQGEHAHNEGFVIASREAFRKLFAVGATELRETKASSPSMLDRLMCVAVPARVIGQASGQTVFEAVSYIRDQAKRRIQEIRDQSASSFRSGMLHALYLHQFANSSLALERLSR
jgi:SAM-dependent methyltransferase